MKYTILVLAALCLFVGGAALARRSNVRQLQQQPITLREKIEVAKKEGKNKVYIPAPIPLYAEVDSLDEAIAGTTVVVATPIEKTSILLATESIATFYKLKIIDTLSQPNVSSGCCDPSLPSELSALTPGEIYLRVGGGTVTIDGVKVIRAEEFGGLKLNQQHLFFLSQNASQPVAMVKLGTIGIFKVSDNNNLETIAAPKNDLKEHSQSRVKSVIEEGLERLHGNSLARLKASIKEKREKQI